MADKYYTSTFLPIKKNLQTKELSWAVPGLLQDAYAAYTAPSRALQGQIDVNSPQGLLEANNFALNIVGGSSLPKLGTKMQPGSLGITAWHGTPHEISGNKLDLSKIGTGEGNQSYSHGFYFAEAPAVATTYKMPSKGVEGTAARYLNMYKTPENAISALEDNLTSNITELGKQHTQKAIDLLKQGKATTGNLYKVDIADEAIPKMLDWFEPVPKDVHQNLSSKAMEKWQSGLSDTSGQHLYKELVKNFWWGGSKTPEADASSWLLQNGIPGVKYPDAGSRGLNRTGTNNYVIYDPNLVKILEKNGLLIP